MAERKTWLADQLRAAMPTREQLEANRWIRPVAHLLLQPALWRFTRRSVPRAIGLGLFAGIFIMIPFVQFASAALIAVPFRANVPLTAGTTLLTNPVTTPLIILTAIWVGSTVFGLHADPATLMALYREGADWLQWKAWLLSDAAPALILGLFTIASVAGSVGYVAAGLIWRGWIAHKWKQRQHNRAIRG
ncbi:DUF2062 domain-containing protein [Sphingomonas sp. ID0503]|uniref:DUF2062 domain-containing protein n=1 Tax=Sphingomonas sp. ID0503 TaxID=3399691 RepID=UPI003AFAD02D